MKKKAPVKMKKKSAVKMKKKSATKFNKGLKAASASGKLNKNPKFTQLDQQDVSERIKKFEHILGFQYDFFLVNNLD